MQPERRLSTRKPPEQLAYISLPPDNGGIVLDLSEGGLRFHAAAPVDAEGPIHFRFSVTAETRVDAVGELTWKDESERIGGLRFTQLPDEMCEFIRVWSGQAIAELLDIPISEVAPEPVVEAETAPRSDVDLAPILEDEFAPLVVRLVPPLPPLTLSPYEMKSQLYTAPFYSLSMFPLDLDLEVRAEIDAPRDPVSTRHPLATVTLTIVLASVIATGIFAYMSTSLVGELLIYRGEKVLMSLRP